MIEAHRLHVESMLKFRLAAIAAVELSISKVPLPTFEREDWREEPLLWWY